MVSLCRQYYQFFLAQAVLLGVGMSFIAIPTSTYVPMYFKRNQGLAQGISIGGASLGGLVWPVALDHMLNRRRIGFGWTMRVVAFTMIPMLAVVLLTLRPPMSAAAASRPADKEQQRQDSSRGDDDDVSASTGTVEKETPPIVFSLKRPAYILLCFGLAFAYFGFFAPLFYVSVYATHLGHSENFAFYLVSILNGASLFGRTLPGFMADKYGHFNVIVVAVLGSAVVVFSWTMAVSIAGLVVWTFAYGFVSGAILSQQLACAGLLSTPETRGVAVGFVMASVSLAGLFGTPIAGALVRHGYLALSCFAGAMLITGAVFLAGARIAVGKKLLAKV
jgi:MFS family permease